jgi:hypothetical protein
MCDSIDGSTTCVVIFGINALYFALSGQEYQAKIPGQVSDGFYGLKNDSFMTKTNPGIIAETCLVAFTILSYIIPKREDLVLHF